jgi:hypothetical protein
VRRRPESHNGRSVNLHSCHASYPLLLDDGRIELRVDRMEANANNFSWAAAPHVFALAGAWRVSFSRKRDH